MRILLTGAAGFIGSNLAHRLLRDGHHVVGVDNLSTGRMQNLAGHLSCPGFSFVMADAILPLNIEGRIDWILHFASPASPPVYLSKPIETLRVNSEGTYHLLELAMRKNACFFFASTSEIYGDPLVHPQPETYWGNVSSIGTRSVYDEAKRYGEALVCAFHRKFDLPIRLIRIFNTYGPNMDPNDGRVVSNLICQALRGDDITIYGDGSQTRSFQFVDDLVDGIVSLINVDCFEPVNMGNPEEYTVQELAHLIRNLIGSSSQFVYRPLPADDPRQRRPDISRAQKLLSWTPVIPVELGLRRTIDYFRRELGLGEPHDVGPSLDARAPTAPTF